MELVPDIRSRLVLACSTVIVCWILPAPRSIPPSSGRDLDFVPSSSTMLWLLVHHLMLAPLLQVKFQLLRFSFLLSLLTGAAHRALKASFSRK